jgi:hypothetical protein
MATTEPAASGTNILRKLSTVHGQNTSNDNRCDVKIDELAGIPERCDRLDEVCRQEMRVDQDRRKRDRDRRRVAGASKKRNMYADFHVDLSVQGKARGDSE